MKDWIIFRPIKDLYNSLFNNEEGFSFRKIAAIFSIIVVAAKETYSIVSDVYKFYAVVSWLVFAAVCIGLVTIPDLIKFLNKTKEEKDGTT